jgi:hypothetical protein
MIRDANRERAEAAAGPREKRENLSGGPNGTGENGILFPEFPEFQHNDN